MSGVADLFINKILKIMFNKYFWSLLQVHAHHWKIMPNNVMKKMA
jgi:hypothetical protein